MKKNKIVIYILLILCIILTSCGKNKGEEYVKYQSTFMELFDTYSIIMGYAKTEEEFNEYANIIYERLKELDHKYDIYNSYEGINNLKTINDNAGISAVTVSDDIIELLKFGKEAYEYTNGKVNIAMGSVLKIWHDYRMEGKEKPQNAKLPPMDLLKNAVGLTDINDLIIDEKEHTVYLSKKGMSLDVGAIAKGYAVQLAVEQAKAAGLQSVLADIGGNVCSVGKPFDGIRDRWGVGIQDPKLSVGEISNIIDTVYVNDAAIVTSGNYQRYYIVDGKAYHHIIDIETLMPAERYESVTVVCEDSGVADMLSTALYLMPVEEGKEVLSKMNAEAIWIYDDGSIEATDGYKKISKKLGNYSAVGGN